MVHKCLLFKINIHSDRPKYKQLNYLHQRPCKKDRKKKILLIKKNARTLKSTQEITQSQTTQRNKFLT